jgi:hypothetical protein
MKIVRLGSVLSLFVEKRLAVQSASGKMLMIGRLSDLMLIGRQHQVQRLPIFFCSLETQQFPLLLVLILATIGVLREIPCPS